MEPLGKKRQPESSTLCELDIWLRQARLIRPKSETRPVCPFQHRGSVRFLSPIVAWT